VGCASVVVKASPEGRAVAAIDARAAVPGAGCSVWFVSSRPDGQEVLVARFFNAQVPEVMQSFWAALQAGAFITDAAEEAGTYRKQGTRWIAACGGVRPRRGRDLKGRCLTFAEREEIALARARGETIRGIARRLARSPSTISRELRRNCDRSGGYRATSAHALAYERASRPKPAKLAVNVELRAIVQEDLGRRFSPEQIAGRLRRRFPDRPEMWVSTETIYQSLYVQSRGALKRELTRHLRTGRSMRKPGRQPGQRRSRIADMVHISQRPPEADERRVPGHWEGDLLIGKRNATAIGTLVERSSGFAMLVGLPDGYKPEHVAPALARKIQTLPNALRRSLTWDQGPEMHNWKQVNIATGIDVYFCDPHSPWQRGSNENTNGLLRQYFPKGFDFSTITEHDLDTVADELNQRPRKRFEYATPTEQLSQLLLQ
jgi:IS30 family transposase